MNERSTSAIGGTFSSSHRNPISPLPAALDFGFTNFWRLDESAPTRADRIGSSNLVPNLAPQRVAFGSSYGAKFLYNGSSESYTFQTHSGLELGDDKTICGFVNMYDKGADLYIAKKDDGGLEYVLYYDHLADRFKLQIGLDDDSTVTGTFTGAPTANAWYFIAAAVYSVEGDWSMDLIVNDGAPDTVALGAGRSPKTGTGSHLVLGGGGAFSLGQWTILPRKATADDLTQLYGGGAGIINTEDDIYEDGTFVDDATFRLRLDEPVGVHYQWAGSPDDRFNGYDPRPLNKPAVYQSSHLLGDGCILCLPMRTGPDDVGPNEFAVTNLNGVTFDPDDGASFVFDLDNQQLLKIEDDPLLVPSTGELTIAFTVNVDVDTGGTILDKTDTDVNSYSYAVSHSYLNGSGDPTKKHLFMSGFVYFVGGDSPPYWYSGLSGPSLEYLGAPFAKAEYGHDVSVALVYHLDTGESEAYINGQLAKVSDAQTHPVNILPSNMPLYIGGNPGSTWFIGKMRDLWIADRAWTLSDAQAHYNGGAGHPDGGLSVVVKEGPGTYFFGTDVLGTRTGALFTPSTADLVGGTRNFTLAGWTAFDDPAAIGDDDTLLKKGGPAHLDYKITIDPVTQKVQFETEDSSVVISSVVIDDSLRHLVCCGYDADLDKVWISVDNEAKVLGNGGGGGTGYNDNTAPFLLGGYGSPYGLVTDPDTFHNFSGSLAWWGVANIVWDSALIAAFWNDGNGIDPTL